MKKLYYSIREISQLIDEEQHILRYWEREFSTLKPKKNSAGNRKYAEKDVELIKKIKILLREKKFTIQQAKDYINKGIKPETESGDSNLFSNINVYDSRSGSEKQSKLKAIEVERNDLVNEIEELIEETIKFLKI